MMVKKTRDKAIARKIKDTLKHFPNKIGKEIHDYVINNVLLESRYIFTWTSKGKQIGYCTHCKKEHKPMYRLKHKTKTKCPKCNSTCRVQAVGYSRKYMIDQAYFVYYEKSKADKEAVIARGFTVKMNFSGDHKNVKPEYETDARYLFEMGNPVFINTYYSWPDRASNYELRKSVFTLYKETGYFGVPTERNQRVSIDSIRKAIKGTQFQYSEWDDWQQVEMKDYVSYFALYAKHPQIEYLMKLGFRQFVNNKLHNVSMYRSINWNGKTLDKVLRVSRQDMKEITRNAQKIMPFTLAVYQLGKRDGSNFTIDEANEFRYENLEGEFEWMKKNSQGTTLRRLFNYLSRQVKKADELSLAMEMENEDAVGERHTTVREQLIMLRDYWSGCVRLNLKVGEDIAEYPSDLTRAHDNVYKQIKFKENKELDQRIKERIKDLLEFKNEQFFMRPFASTREIIHEGKILKHCIGNYSDKYANGKTDLYVIRKHNEPDKPFYSLEIIDGKVRQYYGYKNNQTIKKSKEVIEFVNQLEAELLKDKNNKREIAS